MADPENSDFKFFQAKKHEFVVAMPNTQLIFKKFVTNLNNFTLENDYYNSFLVADTTYENYEYH